MKKSSHPAVVVDHLIKRYRQSTCAAIDDISFEVAQGEFFTFLGPNGAGKTTTISILNTTLAKSSGTVTVAGFDSERQAHHIRRSIGVIFQNPSLDKNLTAEENIRFHAMLYGVHRFAPTYSLMPTTYKKNVLELAELLGISSEIHKPIKTFSGGMKRKLEIIRSLIHQPTILFLDEPTTGLDPESRRNLWEYLRNVRREHGTTMFLTTHYLDEAEESDRVCVIVDGKIVSLSTPAQLKRRLLHEELILDVGKDARAALRRALHELQLTFTGDGPFHINDRKMSVQELLTELSRRTIHLTHTSIHAPTLEQAYLAVLAEHSKNHGATP